MTPPIGAPGLGLIRRWTSQSVAAYVRHSPVERGKWRLLSVASRFLVVEIERGLWVRAAQPHDSMEKAIIYGWKERIEAAAFLEHVRPGMTVLDVGANLGLYSLLLARRVGQAGRVHSFEPTPRLVEKLRINVRLNGLNNVNINAVAVSDRWGTARFFIHEEDDRSSLAAVSGTAIEVPTLTLDGYLQQNGIAKVDVMKIDVEGAEVGVLRGASKLLSSPNAPVILLEVNPGALELMGNSSQELIAILEGHGYCLQNLAEHEGYRNVLATRETPAAEASASKSVR